MEHRRGHMINKDLSIPLYEQVKIYLEEKIISNEWAVGHRLPTEKELSKKFNVSNITVKRAIHELVNEGHLYRQSGKGTFVKRKEEKNLSELVSLRNEEWEEASHPHRTLSFDKEFADSKVSNCLQIGTSDEVYKIKRVKIEEDTPVAIEYSFIPVKLVPELPSSTIENELLYNIFQNKFNIKLNRAKVYFSVIAADEHEANLLGVPLGEQLTVIERYTITDKEEIVEYSRFILKDNGAKYYLEVKI